MSPTPQPTSAPRGRAYATFRPVRGAWVARVMAAVTLLVFTLVAILSPSYEGASAIMSMLNRLMIVVLGLAMAAFIWRYSQIRAVPTERGLTVVNLVRRHELEWAQIMTLGFSGGAPWAVLELTDTEELAVMAIQRADGDLARAEASRLAALIQHHQRGAGD